MFLLGEKTYRFLYTLFFRIFEHKFNKIYVDNPKIEYQKYGIKGADAFFGYYDINPISNDSTKLLTNIVYNKSKVAEIGYFDINTGEFFHISNTRAWNWQMGSRLRWIESGKTIMFNDYDGEKFVSYIYDIYGKKISSYKNAFFDVDLERGFGYFTDFSVLHHYRPGYGYSNVPYLFKEESLNNGLYRYNLKNHEVMKILDINMLRNKYSKHKDDIKFESYINHICVNQKNGMLSFFYIEVEEENYDLRSSQLFVCNSEGKVISQINNFDQVSHYCWKNEREILLTVMYQQKIEYRLYNVLKKNSEYKKIELLDEDGHPSYVSENVFLTDSYPDKLSYQSVYLYHETKKIKKICSVYHQPFKIGEFRCDLHPHFYRDTIHIDTNFCGRRSHLLFNIKNDLCNYTKSIE